VVVDDGVDEAGLEELREARVPFEVAPRRAAGGDGPEGGRP
jgi:hypothetical protein